MADSKISALTALTGADVALATDVMPIVDTNVTTTKKITVEQLGVALSTDTAAQLDVENQTLAGGVVVTVKDLGTISSGTVTPDTGDRPIQKYVNGGAHTLAPSANVGTTLVEVTNNGSAGAITTSGFNKVSGDSFTTTNTDTFLCNIIITTNKSWLIVLKA
jgi:hypothetical protein